MGTSSFQHNSLIAVDGKPFRLLRKVSDNVWQAEEEKTKRVREFTDHQLLQMYEQGNLVFINDVRADCPLPGKNTGCQHQDISDEQFEEAKIKRAYVMAIRDIPGSRSALEPVIKEVWGRIKKPEQQPFWTTVTRWKSRYDKSGGDIRSLVGDSRYGGNRTRRYPQAVIDIVRAAINDSFMTRERKTIQDTLDDAIVRIENENRYLPTSMKLPAPTRRLVAGEIESIPAFDKWAARYGHTAAIKKFRSVKAHRTTAVPLERAEIDHTPLDMIIIDEELGLPLGRPYLTACIDDFTRCILGIYVSFEPPSYLTVAKCLLNSFLPKTTLREQYPTIHNEWAAHGVMRELVVDNGLEFHSSSLENACFTLGVELHYAPRKTGWFKGKIERFLGSLNRGIAHGVPGTTFSNIFDKDDYDPSKFAVVRLSTLHEIIHLWIADHYHQKPHRALGMPPAVLWESSIKPEDIQLPDNPSEFKAILGRSETRQLTHKGIELDGLQYNSPDLQELRRRLGDVLTVELRIDDTDIGTIVVLSPDRAQRFSAKALKFDYANGLSRWQHRVCRRFAAREHGKYDPMSWLEAKHTINALIEDEFMLRKSKSRKKIARFNGNKNAEGFGVETPPVADVVDSLPLPPEASCAPKAGSPATAPDKPERPRKKFTPVHRERDPLIIEEERNGEA